MKNAKCKNKVILKLGGSLIEKSRDILRVLVDYARERDGDKNRDFTLVLIPGGGPFAETVRNISATMSIPDETAHWMAVLAMHQHGLFLAACIGGGEAEIPLVESVDENEIDRAGPICILLPYKILKQDDCLPHTWDVTSDTIAAFVANRLGEKRFIKLTDVDKRQLPKPDNRCNRGERERKQDGLHKNLLEWRCRRSFLSTSTWTWSRGKRIHIQV
jgi:aspartokinase-like uncharacterized kinase